MSEEEDFNKASTFGFSTYAELLVTYQIIHVPSGLPRCSSAEDEDEQCE